MRVRVLFFGRLKDITGCAEDWAELDDGCVVEDLFARYGRQFPALAAFRPSLVASVNEEFADWRAPLRAGDEVAFLPPVSGGTSRDFGTAIQDDIYEITRQPIRSAEIVAALKAPGDGAVVVFDGIVRNNSGGRETLHLEYEAYEPMALKKMREIGEEARKKFPIHRVAIVHRLGKLDIGETSVLIVVSSPHRAAAFDACRFAIDILKRTVPIWKKEFFRGGAVWVEGEIPRAPEGSTKPFSTPDESTS
ncbi:MAG: molybdenum cofactor biosynthesis protein MoaE [Acidobacteria bacterium]|nr:molybdenum cofactor biosynthesis protein MoaE [Acidobacteriota bacterium]MBI3662550.1 molybdenum cofactor biosynthesis protein MoaE [Acidobacteriota bacterium]